MLLGVYWYYHFPKGLYHFDYFTFRPGQGGFANGPAELTATVQAPDPAALLAEVQAVAARYPDGYLFARTHAVLLQLELSDYALSDYTFHVATELEQVLRRQQATLATEALPSDQPLLRLAELHDPYAPYRYGDGFLQAVSTAPRRHHAELALLRLDCHLPLLRRAAFFAALSELCAAAGLDVLYYFDRELSQQVNLMVFFGNGRQGVGGQPLRYTDPAAVREGVAACLAAHEGQPGHLGGYPADYPRRGPHMVRVVDRDFTL